MVLRHYIYPSRMLTHESFSPKNSIFTIVCSHFWMFRWFSSQCPVFCNVIGMFSYILLGHGEWNSTCFVCTQLSSMISKQSFPKPLFLGSDINKALGHDMDKMTSALTNWIIWIAKFLTRDYSLVCEKTRSLTFIVCRVEPTLFQM